MLKSTLPVDLQTELGQALLTQRGQLGAQRAQDISGVRTRLGQLGLQRTGSIQDLANALQQQSFSERQFKFDKSLAERQFELNKRLALMQRAASQAASKQGSAISSLVDLIKSRSGNQGLDLAKVLAEVQKLMKTGNKLSVQPTTRGSAFSDGGYAGGANSLQGGGGGW